MNGQVIGIFHKVKRFTCDRFIIFFAFLIRKCADNEKFQNHINKTNENQEKSKKFDFINSKKEDLLNGINQQKVREEELYLLHIKVVKVIGEIQESLNKNDIEKAKNLCAYVLNFYKNILEK